MENQEAAEQESENAPSGGRHDPSLLGLRTGNGKVWSTVCGRAGDLAWMQLFSGQIVAMKHQELAIGAAKLP